MEIIRSSEKKNIEEIIARSSIGKKKKRILQPSNLQKTTIQTIVCMYYLGN